MRIYDPRVGRFLSVDPLTKKYPELTPFQFAGNTPIQAIDLDGAETYFQTEANRTKRQAQMTIDDARFTAKRSEQNKLAVHSQPPSLHTSPQSTATMQAPDMSYDAVQLRQETRDQRQYQNNINGATMDPIAGGISYGGLTAAKSYLQGALQHGYGIYEGVKEKDAGTFLENSALLALDASPFLLSGGTAAATYIPRRLARIIPEEFAGSPTLGRAGAPDVFVVDASALKGITNSTDLAKKLTLLDENNNLIKGPFRVVEFDTPTEGLAQPINRTNPGFVHGGQTAGGATEYVLPNLEVKSLRNVTQKTIR